MQHPASIGSLYTYLSLWIYWLYPLIKVKYWDKNIPLLFRMGLGARSRTLTDVGIMVIAKSCLNQTQHSGLTITANGHICHLTKNGVCVCLCCSQMCGSLNNTKCPLLLLAELKIVFTGREGLHRPLMSFRVDPLIEWRIKMHKATIGI